MICSLWQQFLTNYNGMSYMLSYQWVSNGVLELYTDSTGGANLGGGVYFEGKGYFYSGQKSGRKQRF